MVYQCRKQSPIATSQLFGPPRPPLVVPLFLADVKVPHPGLHDPPAAEEAQIQHVPGEELLDGGPEVGALRGEEAALLAPPVAPHQGEEEQVGPAEAALVLASPNRPLPTLTGGVPEKIFL